MQLTLQPDLFGGWELLRETGQIGAAPSSSASNTCCRTSTAAFEKARDGHVKRGFQVTFDACGGAEGVT